MKNIICFDNNGETFDRFTILNKKTGDMIGSSVYPFAPNGFGMHCGNVADNYWNVAYGYSWRRRCDEKKCIKFAVNHFLADCSHVGEIIDFDTLPEDVKKFARQSFTIKKKKLITMNTETKRESLQNFAGNFNLEIKEYIESDKRKATKFVAVIAGSNKEVSNKFTYDEMNIFLIGILRSIEHQLKTITS